MNSPVELTPEQIEAVGKTALRKFNKPPLVYRCFAKNQFIYFNGTFSLANRVLDYGCGRNPFVKQPKNPDWVNYDICHFPNRPEGLFDAILVSNVLNVLPDQKTLIQTIGDIVSFLQPEGAVFVNFPSAPRKGKMPDGSVIGHEYVKTLLNLSFKEVERVEGFGAPSSPVYLCVGRK